MHAIRGVYDGKTIRPLPEETLPKVKGEVPVQIIFLEPEEVEEEVRQRRMAALQRLLKLRDSMEPLDCSVKDLIEYGRYR